MPAKSKQQQKFFSVVRAMQKGDMPKKGDAGEVADDMKKKDVKKMAKTKHKRLPQTIKEMIAQELVKELQLNEVKPFRDKKLVSQFHDKTKNIFYLATNDHRYPTEIVLWDAPKKQFIFIYGQMGKFTNSSPTERISANKLSKTHWVWPYHAGVAGNVPLPGETMQQKIARNEKGWRGEGKLSEAIKWKELKEADFRPGDRFGGRDGDIPEFSTKAESIEYEMNKIQKGVSISEREPGKFRARWTYARHPLSPTDWKASLKLIIDAGGKIDKNWTRNDYEKNWEPEEPPEWVPSIYFTL